MSPKIFLFIFLFSLLLASIDARLHQSKPGCQKKCGDVIIPYPFGIGSNCSIDKWAEMKCDTSFNPSKLFFTHSIPYEVVGFIFENEGELQLVRVKNNITTICSGVVTSSYDSFIGLKNTPFVMSDYNEFVVIGCSIYGAIGGNLTVGCRTDCERLRNCSVSLPYEWRRNIWVYSVHVQAEALNGSGCGSAYLTDETFGIKPFAVDSVKDSSHSTVTLSYRIRNQTCIEAMKEPHSFACKKHSECHDSYDGSGYLCYCSSRGYKGNPYLPHGCHRVLNVRRYGVNSPATRYLLKWILIGFGLGLLVLGTVVYYMKRKQVLRLAQKLAQLKDRLLLIQEISSRAKIFTSKKLEQATNNFHESRILGQGGFGTVYKGILPDQSFIAVKKMKLTEKRQLDTFINEVAILIKIEHRNIVKLMGCSVDSEHPLLVYEFVSNGTLADHLFKKNGMPYSFISWENRLRIAIEIAGALAYLHSAASIPIIHRDVKSNNILLDDNFTAKVADFGLSRINHLDQTEINTLVKGTMGYLDPEYMLTSQLTEKSDVFSFGVVVAELLTGKKSISFERAEGERNLAIFFSALMNEERLLDIVEDGIVNEGNIDEVQVVATLVQRCLSFKGEERPSMKEVASKLEMLRGFNKKSSS